MLVLFASISLVSFTFLLLWLYQPIFFSALVLFLFVLLRLFIPAAFILPLGNESVIWFTLLALYLVRLLGDLFIRLFPKSELSLKLRFSLFCFLSEVVPLFSALVVASSFIGSLFGLVFLDFSFLLHNYFPGIVANLNLLGQPLLCNAMEGGDSSGSGGGRVNRVEGPPSPTTPPSLEAGQISTPDADSEATVSPAEPNLRSPFLPSPLNSPLPSPAPSLPSPAPVLGVPPVYPFPCPESLSPSSSEIAEHEAFLKALKDKEDLLPETKLDAILRERALISFDDRVKTAAEGGCSSTSSEDSNPPLPLEKGFKGIFPKGSNLSSSSDEVLPPNSKKTRFK